MVATGIVRRVDDLGRVVIPKEIRRQMGVYEGTPMEMFLSKDQLVMQVYKAESTLNEKLNDLLKEIDECDRDVVDDNKVQILKSHLNLMLATLEVK